MEAHWLTPPKKLRTQPLAGKIMATVFWDSKDVIFNVRDYKPAGTSITGDYFVIVIKQIRVAIKEKKMGKASRWCPSFA